MRLSAKCQLQHRSRSSGQDKGEKTLYEKNLSKIRNKLEKEMNSDLVKDFTSAFPGAKLTNVTEEEDA